MRNYQVTRKLQITIPKVLAKELRIRAGDAVVFEKAGNALLVKKAGTQIRDYTELKETVEALAEDMEKVGKHIEMVERSIGANLSGHIGPKP